ncbi:MAG: type II toxin-antitoxin system RelE/ParE family toxin, partial [Desulfobacterales bacterium]|nr:type II toxin-antitoxin system RelE/ParE family toxin [Desulfobacterales bacterium]
RSEFLLDSLFMNSRPFSMERPLVEENPFPDRRGFTECLQEYSYGYTRNFKVGTQGIDERGFCQRSDGKKGFIGRCCIRGYLGYETRRGYRGRRYRRICRGRKYPFKAAGISAVKIRYTKKFSKDLDKIKDQAIVKKRLLVLIQTMKEVDELTVLKDVKKIQGYTEYFRLKVGDYRLGLKMTEGAIEMIRFLHRKDIYRRFP